MSEESLVSLRNKAFFSALCFCTIKVSQVFSFICSAFSLAVLSAFYLLFQLLFGTYFVALLRFFFSYLFCFSSPTSSVFFSPNFRFSHLTSAVHLILFLHFVTPVLSAFCLPPHLLFVSLHFFCIHLFCFSSLNSSAFKILLLLFISYFCFSSLTSAFHLSHLLLFISHFFCFSSPTSFVFFSPNF
jgi:hypothetical protein